MTVTQLERRQGVERKIVERVATDLIAAGFQITLNNGEQNVV